MSATTRPANVDGIPHVATEARLCVMEEWNMCAWQTTIITGMEIPLPSGDTPSGRLPKNQKNR